ncbi:hypothetical protein AB0J80_02220 [Actinoplanes sp. NPDC049548]|uniref:hypothetical protein n=1 Tax=Actinoplanes sp. NPDC049548 TaxID=3155152 RepID=UPI0034238D20
MKADAAERVRAGARWLDAHRPGWHHRIRPLTLQVGSEIRCPLGQEFGTWANAPEPARSDPDLGFYAYSTASAECGAEYQLLTLEWQRMIAARRRNDQGPGPPNRPGLGGPRSCNPSTPGRYGHGNR